MITINIDSWRQNAGTLQLTSSVSSGSYKTAKGYDTEHCDLTTQLEFTSSTTQILTMYDFVDVEVTALKETQNGSDYQQLIGVPSPTIYTRRMEQDGVTIKVRKPVCVSFHERGQTISDYISFD